MYVTELTSTVDFGEWLIESLELGMIVMCLLWIRLLNKRLTLVERRQDYVRHLMQHHKLDHLPTDAEVAEWVREQAPQHRKRG